MTRQVFVTTDWLAAHLADPGVAVIDASWYLPTLNRNARAEYLQGHIPGAVFFDIDAIADHSSGLPHMLPKPEAFAAAMGALGLSNELAFVVYDSAGLYSAARVWWTLRVYGVQSVFVLKGGLPRWKAEGRTLESGEVTRPATRFVAHLDERAIMDMEQVARALDSKAAQVVDARPAERFRGEASEPRAGVRSGHIPGSVNLPYTDLIEGGQLKPPASVAEEFAQAGVDFNEPVITMCGSGVTAAIVAMAAVSLGHPMPALYDGSWSEWGSQSNTPVATGAASAVKRLTK